MFLKKISFFLVFALLYLSCKQAPERQVSNEMIQLVQSLKTDNAKQAFLDDILNSIMNDRKMKIAEDVMLKNDELRLDKIEAYLKTYEYPSKDKYGIKAARAPIMTLHYSKNLDAKFNNFEAVYKGFYKGHFSPEDFAYFIGHLHKDAKGEWYSFDGPYTSKEEIEANIKSLGLQDEVDEIIKGIKK